MGLVGINPLSVAAGPIPTSTVRDAHVDPTNNGDAISEPSPLIPWHPEGELNEDDFHSGTPQLVLAGDGTKLCPSILLTNQLFTDFVTAITARRMYGDLHRSMALERHNIMVRRDNLFAQILDWSSKLYDLRNGPQDEARDRRIQDLEEAKEKFEHTLEDLELRDEQLVKQLKNAEQEWNRLQFKVDVALDRAFTNIGVLSGPIQIEEQAELPESPADPEPQPDPVDIPENTWNEAIDYSELVSGPNEWKCGVRDHPDSTFNNDYYDYFPRPDPIQAAQELEARTQEFEDAEYEFDVHRDYYDVAFLEWRLTQKGRLDANDLEIEFGPIWLKRGQEVTRKFRDAEEAYYIAQARAEEAGVQATHDEDEPEAYEGNENEGLESSRKRKRIEDWMDAHFVREAWKSEADLQSDPSQHWSVLDDWPKRRKIADYNRRVGRDR